MSFQGRAILMNDKPCFVLDSRTLVEHANDYTKVNTLHVICLYLKDVS